MKRRDLIKLLGSAAAWPVVARAEVSPKLWRIGLLETIPPELNTSNLGGLRRGLHDLGYDEGRNYVFEYRSAGGHSEQFPRLAAELLGERVDLIVTRGTPATRAAKTATSTLPIVMASVGEALGIINTLAHPGGNVTGMSAFTTGLAAKRVELLAKGLALLKEAVPSLAEVAILWNPANQANSIVRGDVETTARALGLKLHSQSVREPKECDSVHLTDSCGLGLRCAAKICNRKGFLATCGLEQRIPADHPLRAIRELVDAALKEVSRDFNKLYARDGRPSIPQSAVPLVCRVVDRRPGVGCDGVLQEPGSAARRRYRSQVLCRRAEPAAGAQASVQRALLG
jgi:hypothetical protein